MAVVFSESEIERFIEDGYVVLRGGFAPDVAADGRAFLWQRLGLKPDDPTTWRELVVHVQETFSGAPFDRVMTRRLRAALEQLMGPGRGTIRTDYGWWPVLFPGFEGPGGWHVDGHDFRHHLTSPEQGIVPLFLFSDIASGGGGTPMLRGSHHEIARLLADAEPSGLDAEALNDALPRVDPTRIVEVTGEAGDVAFMHPFLVHGFGANRSTTVRFACNPRYSLIAPMQIDRADGAYSPVETAIRRALG